ncbi:phosphoribosyltransferase family protein [Actinomycetospora straminea]|uniref:Phosphoribosyltransferase family protein n=1 Tax=Actinomycetospora straminea TaxID=663607 RepID=A0ABP9EJ32_9PSEU|nr:phosphoribosyltransferase family protein [Actinomycetospora straminea]MDD7933168.1 phosphoribosyltransferase family protein [Actinomycetospora straminea]
MTFDDRDDAGHRLARHLRHLAGQDVVVLALPRSGVPVAAVVARALDAPLDVLVTRTLGVPFQPGVAMGAIGEDGTRVLDEDVVRAVGAGEAELTEVERRERVLLEQALRRYRSARTREPLAGRVALIVDDGAVAPATVQVACRIARARTAARVVVAVPVCADDALATLRRDADQLVVIDRLRQFHVVGEAYADYPLVDDDEVVALLSGSDAVRRVRPLDGEPTATIAVDVDRLRVPGHLTVPVDARGLVVLAAASGSSRFDARQRATARALRAAGLATLVVDLLTPREEIVRDCVFGTDVLATRLAGVVADTRRRDVCRDLPVGVLAEGAAAAAALVVAARRTDVATVVSCDGRPDLVARWLPRVTAPVLLVVGDRDPALADRHRDARAALGGDSRLRVVTGSGRTETTDLAADTPSPLDLPTRPVELAREWFVRTLSRSAAPSAPPLAVAP